MKRLISSLTPHMSIALIALTAFLLPAQAQSYRAQAGDTLQVEVVEDPSLNRSVIVLPNGQMSFPFAGTFQAGGRSLGQISNVITSALSPNYAAPPTVFVSVGSIAPEMPPMEPIVETINVYAMGEVNAPGLKEVAAGTTIVQFMAQSGGFTNFAATKRVQLRRTDPATGRETVYTINYDALEAGAAFTGGNRLVEGDVFLVPERGLFE